MFAIDFDPPGGGGGVIFGGGGSKKFAGGGGGGGGGLDSSQAIMVNFQLYIAIGFVFRNLTRVGWERP